MLVYYNSTINKHNVTFVHKQLIEVLQDSECWNKC